MTIGSEAALLLRVARPALLDTEVDEVRGLIAAQDDELDWGLFIDLAFRHHVLPLASRNMLHYQLHPGLARQGGFLYEEMFTNAYQVNQVRNEALARELVTILRELARRSVRPVLRKGAVLGQELYGDVGVRRSFDIDLMVEPDELPVVEEVLGALGYAEGNLSANRRVVVPRDRRQALFWAMRVPNRQLHRPTSERFVNTFVVDICLNHFLPGTRYDLPAADLANRSRTVYLFGVPARAFTPEETVIDLTTHLFKEATSLHYLKLAKDLTLSKFLDIATLAGTQPIDWSVVRERVDSYGVREPVYFALHYTDVVYPGAVPGDVLDAFRVSDLAFLREIGHVDKDVRQWQGDFMSRLFDSRRAADLPFPRVSL
ncbi:nucleotidyltransferase domain-containing protein [Micromonospora sp. DT229]|uniref:nucleotidyltransferase domain-containing protein n=1 Tax=Micromonospora sp. DT229 TaxID=3393430 RepID=UPI003CECBD3E